MNTTLRCLAAGGLLVAAITAAAGFGVLSVGVALEEQDNVTWKWGALALGAVGSALVATLVMRWMTRENTV